MQYSDYNQYSLTELQLTCDEFLNLIFMGPPPIWRKHPHQHNLLLNLCYKTIGEVVDIIKNHLSITSLHGIKSAEVFQKLQNIVAKDQTGQDESKPWFEKHLILSEKFDKRLMDPLWVRNPSIHGDEKQYCDKNKQHLYIQDGNHRALVYAVRVRSGEDGSYDPVKAIHATSWKFAEGLLKYRIQESTALEDNGNLYPDIEDYITGFNSNIKILKRIEAT